MTQKKQEKKELYIIDQNLMWNAVERVAQLAVVQIYASVSEFDWIEPYRIGIQHEVFGSGFFVNEEGFFVTTAHVISNAQHIFIRIPLLRHQLLEVSVVEIFPELDLALLVISENAKAILKENDIVKLPFLALGDSYALHRTQSLLVLGYPYGSMTLKGSTGILSGREQVKDIMLLQISAPINEGNSGGPVLDSQGSVVGIAVAVLQDARNIGYAIPIQIFIDVFTGYQKKQVLKRKNVWGIIGVVSKDAKAEWLQCPKQSSGFYVANVYKDTVFDVLGVQTGDMLCELQQCPMNAYGEVTTPWSSEPIPLSEFLLRFKIGEKISLVVCRKGKRVEIEGEVPLCNPFSILVHYPKYETIAHETIGGLVIMELTLNHVVEFMQEQPEFGKYVRPELWYTPQLLVTHVLPGSIMQQSMSIMPGDIIESINDGPVFTVSDVQKALPKSLKTGFLTIQTTHKILSVEKISSVLAAEEQLCQTNDVPMSKLVKKMMKG